MTAIEEAAQIILGDREQTYGHPSVNLERIADSWSSYLMNKYGTSAGGWVIGSEDVCWMMALLKMCRQMHKPKRDNVVDALGYIALIDRLESE